MPADPIQPACDDALTSLECTSIALSRNDPASSLKPPGRFAWLVGRGPMPLANPRLETLRRYAVLRRLGSDLAGRERLRLCELGYSPGQLADIDRMIADFPVRPPPRRLALLVQLTGLFAGAPGRRASAPPFNRLDWNHP
jgi:hypothetical protein